jgi:hypothetical protein
MQSLSMKVMVITVITCSANCLSDCTADSSSSPLPLATTTYTNCNKHIVAKQAHNANSCEHEVIACTTF